MQIAARIISWIFLPLFVPMYVLLLTLYVPSFHEFYGSPDCLYDLPAENKIGLIYLFFVFSTLAPAISYIILFRTGMITTIEMDDKRERSLPILIMFFYCMALFSVFYFQEVSNFIPRFAMALPLSGAVVTGLFVLLNRWRKVSIHAGAMGIGTGYILAYILSHTEYAFWMLPLMILASGAVMSARVFLGKHTMLEILVGWFTGTFITFAINYFYP